MLAPVKGIPCEDLFSYLIIYKSPKCSIQTKRDLGYVVLRVLVWCPITFWKKYTLPILGSYRTHIPSRYSPGKSRRACENGLWSLLEKAQTNSALPVDLNGFKFCCTAYISLDTVMIRLPKHQSSLVALGLEFSIRIL